MYKTLLRPFLFLCDAERAHRLSLRALRGVGRVPGGRFMLRLFHKKNTPGLVREVFGISFPNPVGLAAGFDCNGEHLNLLSDLGFGFIEIGTLTTNAQGEKPKTVRLKKDKALVDKRGHANKGVRYAIEQLASGRPQCPICVNLGPGVDSETAKQVATDYETSFNVMYDFADMFTILLPSLPDLSFSDIFDPILDLRLSYDCDKPVLVKINSDIPYATLNSLLDYCMLSGIDGIIADGSTSDTSELLSKSRKIKSLDGGMVSGAPVFERTLTLVGHISEYTKGRLPIIGVGGITTPERAKEILQAGASLIQVYSGLAFEGPKLVKRILKYLESK